MVVDVIMPKMGESITEGTILEWRKKVGDTIEMDEILLEIGTDKVDSEIPSPSAGKIVNILADLNDVVEVGKVIARIETDTDNALYEKEETPPTGANQSEQKSEVNQTSGDRPPRTDSAIPPKSKREEKFFTPMVKKIAQKEGISMEELVSIPGTGGKGRVTKQDIFAYIKTRGKGKTEFVSSEAEQASSTVKPQTLVDERIEMDYMRKLIAEHMRKSVDTSAHVYVFSEVDMTHIVKYISENGDQFKEKAGFSLTYTPFIVLACIQALQKNPDMNSSLEGTTIVRKKNVIIGIAVALSDGLMVPVLSECERFDFLQLARRLQDLVKRTRENAISPEELQGSTFTITNFGVFDVISGTPIINQPNVGILGIGTIKKKPVVIETDERDEIGIRNMMTVSLGFDHRLIDGAGGSRFINTVCQNLTKMDIQSLDL